MSAAAACDVLTAAALNEVSRALVYEHWMFVAEGSWSRAAPLLVAAEARLSKCPSNCDIISSEEKVMAGR